MGLHFDKLWRNIENKMCCNKNTIFAFVCDAEATNPSQSRSEKQQWHQEWDKTKGQKFVTGCRVPSTNVDIRFVLIPLYWSLFAAESGKDHTFFWLKQEHSYPRWIRICFLSADSFLVQFFELCMPEFFAFLETILRKPFGKWAWTVQSCKQGNSTQDLVGNSNQEKEQRIESTGGKA